MKRVKKLWGEEWWIVNRKEYCGKQLFLKRGYRSSLHYHKKKDETFYVFKGLVLMEIGKRKKFLRAGSIQHISPGILHRFTGITDAGITEFSTHDEKSDSYRKTFSEKIQLRKAYDYDGVLTKGIKMDDRSPIITGRSFEQVGVPQLKGHAIYYLPVTWNKKTIKNQAAWKAYMIKRLGIEEFYENDLDIIEILRKKCPNCNIVKI